MPVVLTPIQILLVNLVTDGLPAMALGMDPAQDDVMELSPRSSEESIFSGGLLGTIVFRGMLIGLTTLSMFVAFYRLYGGVEAARTGALMTLIVAQLFHVFECKSETHSLFGVPFFNNKKLIGAVMVSGGIAFLASENTWMRAIFQTIPLTLNQWLLVLGGQFDRPDSVGAAPQAGPGKAPGKPRPHEDGADSPVGFLRRLKTGSNQSKTPGSAFPGFAVSYDVGEGSLPGGIGSRFLPGGVFLQDGTGLGGEPRRKGERVYFWLRSQ